MLDVIVILSLLLLISVVVNVSTIRKNMDNSKIMKQMRKELVDAQVTNATLSWPAVTLGWICESPCGRTVRKFLRRAGDIGPQKAIMEYKEVIHAFAHEASKRNQENADES